MNKIDYFWVNWGTYESLFLNIWFRKLGGNWYVTIPPKVSQLYPVYITVWFVSPPKLIDSNLYIVIFIFSNFITDHTFTNDERFVALALHGTSLLHLVWSRIYSKYRKTLFYLYRHISAMTSFQELIIKSLIYFVYFGFFIFSTSSAFFISILSLGLQSKYFYI